MRPAVFTCVALALLSASALSASASPFKQADEYFRVRDKALQLVETVAPDEVQTHPQKFSGALIEVRGMITAVAGSDAHTTLLVETAPNTPPLMLGLPPDKRLTHWPFLDVGARIRALCRVVTEEGAATGKLELAIPVKEYEASRVDEERAAAAKKKKEEADRLAALKQRQQERTKLSSRGITGIKARPKPAKTRATYSDNQLIEAYAGAVRYFNRRMAVQDAKRIATNIIQYSRRFGLDARLVMAVIAVESNFNPYAVSPKGAMGLGQLMPGTASDLGVGNAYDVGENLEGSTRLLRTHIRNFEANGTPTEEAIKLALACYNAGAGAVRKYRGIPPYRETQNYVKKITRLYLQLKGEWNGQ